MRFYTLITLKNCHTLVWFIPILMSFWIFAYVRGIVPIIPSSHVMYSHWMLNFQASHADFLPLSIMCLHFEGPRLLTIIIMIWDVTEMTFGAETNRHFEHNHHNNTISCTSIDAITPLFRELIVTTMPMSIHFEHIARYLNSSSLLVSKCSKLFQICDIGASLCARICIDPIRCSWCCFIVLIWTNAVFSICTISNIVIVDPILKRIGLIFMWKNHQDHIRGFARDEHYWEYRHLTFQTYKDIFFYFYDGVMNSNSLFFGDSTYI